MLCVCIFPAGGVIFPPVVRSSTQFAFFLEETKSLLTKPLMRIHSYKKISLLLYKHPKWVRFVVVYYIYRVHAAGGVSSFFFGKLHCLYSAHSCTSLSFTQNPTADRGRWGILFSSHVLSLEVLLFSFNCFVSFAIAVTPTYTWSTTHPKSI